MLHCGYDYFADALVFVHGKDAAAEAAKHAVLCEKFGDSSYAETWRKIETAVVGLEARRSARMCKAA